MLGGRTARARARLVPVNDEMNMVIIIKQRKLKARKQVTNRSRKEGTEENAVTIVI